jgi:hypothetical protein
MKYMILLMLVVILKDKWSSRLLHQNIHGVL